MHWATAFPPGAPPPSSVPSPRPSRSLSSIRRSSSHGIISALRCCVEETGVDRHRQPSSNAHCLSTAGMDLGYRLAGCTVLARTRGLDACQRGFSRRRGARDKRVRGRCEPLRADNLTLSPRQGVVQIRDDNGTLVALGAQSRMLQPDERLVTSLTGYRPPPFAT